MKRVLSFLLVLTLCAGLLAATVCAEALILRVPGKGVESVASHDAVTLDASAQQYYGAWTDDGLVVSSVKKEGFAPFKDKTPVYTYVLLDWADKVQLSLPFEGYVYACTRSAEDAEEAFLAGNWKAPAESFGICLSTETGCIVRENGEHSLAVAGGWEDFCLYVVEADAFGQPGTLRCIVQFTGGAKSKLPTYGDVTEADWFYEAAEKASELGLMTGKANRLFAPKDTLTRAELVTMLWRLDGSPEITPEKDFADFYLKDGASLPVWAKPAFVWAAYHKLVTGYEGGELRADEPISRQQTALLLYRYAVLTGNDEVEGGMGLKERDDYGEIADYAMPGMTWAFYNGLLTGSDNRVCPRAPITRAEAAALLVRFAEKYAK